MENKIAQITAELLADKRFAVGNDLVFLPDFKLSYTDLFRNKVYTNNEIDYCEGFNSDSILHYASTWAAKEAAYKALKQIDKSPVGWKKIEILRDKIGGKPNVILHQNPDQFKISLSISHDGDYVWAIAFIEIKP